MAQRSMTSLQPPGLGFKKALVTHMGLRTTFSVSLTISSLRKVF